MNDPNCPDCAGSGTKMVCHGILPEHGNIAQERCNCRLLPPARLNNKYAAQQTEHGLRILEYIEHEGELEHDPYTMRDVVLDEMALSSLAQFICPDGCDMLNDARRDIEKLESETRQ